MLSIIITNSQLKSHEKVCKKKDFCGNVSPTQKNNVSEFNQYMKSDKMQYIIYADIESLIQKWITIKTIFNNKNGKNIFLVPIQYQLFGDLII